MSTQSGDYLRKLTQRCGLPVHKKGLPMDWSVFNESLPDWLNKIHQTCPNPEFEVAPRTHGDSPQFERFRKVDKSINFGTFLAYSSTETEHWASCSYKSIKDIPGVSTEENPMSMAFCGYPEITDEITMWLGSEGAHTPCHYDTYGSNVVVQVHGRKRWWLFPPDTPNMAPTRVPYEESSVYSERNFFSPKDPSANTDLRYSACFIKVLLPGDVLFIPPKWWHYVEALDNSLSFNAWIPSVEDHISRLDEYLVLYQIQKLIPKDTDKDILKILLNPNSIDALDQEMDNPEFLAAILDKITLDDYEAVEEKDKLIVMENIKKQASPIDDYCYYVPEVLSKEFKETMAKNSLRFCEVTEKLLKETYSNPRLLHMSSLINVFTTPAVIKAARKALLRRHFKLLDLK